LHDWGLNGLKPNSMVAPRSGAALQSRPVNG
jgi:hypothetical protein